MTKIISPSLNNNFDLIRLLAALQVVISHSVSHLEINANWGFASYLPGVPIFFFVSGFLISLSYERSPKVSYYAMNRVLRIYPALLVCLIFSIVSVMAVGYKLPFDENMLNWLVAQSTIVQFYNPDFLRGYGVGTLNGSLWSIPVEISFYIFLPLAYVIGGKLQRIDHFFLTLLFLSLTFDAWYNANLLVLKDAFYFKLLGVSLLPYLWMFLVGTLFQRKWDSLKKYVVGKFHVWLLIFISTVILDACYGLFTLGNHPSFLYYLILCLFIISSAYYMDGKLSLWLNGNDISYGVYIYHMIIINMCVYYGLVGKWITFLSVILITLIISYLSWKLVERPALQMKKKSIHRV